MEKKKGIHDLVRDKSKTTPAFEKIQVTRRRGPPVAADRARAGQLQRTVGRRLVGALMPVTAAGPAVN
jgi:hypothetical protein